MKLAMYKGPPDDTWHKIGHEATCLWTFSEYSHCELVFDKVNSKGHSLCASSSSRDNGVRFKYIDLNSGKWDVYELDVTPEQITYAYQWFIINQGKLYDHLGLVWFVLPINQFNDPQKFVCSEALAAALQFNKPHKYHPQKVLDRCKKK